MDDAAWSVVSGGQAGLLSRSDLRRLALTRAFVRAQLDARRWSRVTSTVIATFTGQLTREQLMWAGVLHAGPRSMVAGVTATELAGLRGWDRDEVTILVPHGSRSPSAVDGIDFRRTERDLRGVLASRWGLPRARPEPAALLWASTQRSERTASGLLHALVQQRVSTPEDLASWMTKLGRLRHGAAMRDSLSQMGGGVQSVAEQDLTRLRRRYGITPPRRQGARRDSAGRRRYTDAEWTLADGRTLLLEIDGSFHMDSKQWEDDIIRQRDLTQHGVVMIRCTAREVRDEPDRIARTLLRFGVPTIAERKRSS